MAAKNSIKEYVENSFYHLYNRGVDKRPIFLDSQDFAVFLSYLKTYLLPKDELGLQAIIASHDSSASEKSNALKLLCLKNFFNDIELVSYALMDNHFHFLLKQKSADAIDRFMNALWVRYAAYFNRKYHRVGPLFQGVYKAVLITTDEQLLHLSRYIHLNPLLKLHLPVSRWQEVNLPNSLPEYLGERDTTWVRPEIVLNYFNKASKNNSYWKFIHDYADIEPITALLLDAEEAD